MRRLSSWRCIMTPEERIWLVDVLDHITVQHSWLSQRLEHLVSGSLQVRSKSDEGWLDVTHQEIAALSREVTHLEALTWLIELKTRRNGSRQNPPAS